MSPLSRATVKKPGTNFRIAFCLLAFSSLSSSYGLKHSNLSFVHTSLRSNFFLPNEPGVGRGNRVLDPR